MSNYPGLGGEFEELEVPDVYGTITGYRWWNYRFGDREGSYAAENELLLSSTMTSEFIWPSGTVQALHGGGRGIHRAPRKGCKCGIYALKEKNQNLKSVIGKVVNKGPQVCGRVELWGNVIAHSTGYRAEYAKVTGFFTNSAHIRHLSRLAEYYEVELIQDDLFPDEFAQDSFKPRFKKGDHVKHMNYNKSGFVEKCGKKRTTIVGPYGGNPKTYYTDDLESL